jgi:hypothetical protein
MEHLKKFNENWFQNFLKKETETPVTPDFLRDKSDKIKSDMMDQLKKEAYEKFPSLVKELDNMIRNTNKNYIEVKQNPTFKTKSTKSINNFLLTMIENEYKERGFKIDRSKDGRDYAKYDWFRIGVK